MGYGPFQIYLLEHRAQQGEQHPATSGCHLQAKLSAPMGLDLYWKHPARWNRYRRGAGYGREVTSLLFPRATNWAVCPPCPTSPCPSAPRSQGWLVHETAVGPPTTCAVQKYKKKTKKNPPHLRKIHLCSLKSSRSVGQVFQKSRCLSGDGSDMGEGHLLKDTNPAVTTTTNLM